MVSSPLGVKLNRDAECTEVKVFDFDKDCIGGAPKTGEVLQGAGT